MKKLLLLTTLLGFSQIIVAQKDTIFLHSGTNIICEVIEGASTWTKYRYPNETMVNTISVSEYREIHLASGRVIKGSEPIIISGIEDWNKVVITNVPTLAEGLDLVDMTELPAFVLEELHSVYKHNNHNNNEFFQKIGASRYCHLVVLTDDSVLSERIWTDEGALNIKKVKYYRFKEVPVAKLDDINKERWNKYVEEVIEKAKWEKKKPMHPFYDKSILKLDKRGQKKAVSDVEWYVGQNIDHASKLADLEESQRDTEILKSLCEEMGDPHFFKDAIKAIDRHMRNQLKKLGGNMSN